MLSDLNNINNTIHFSFSLRNIIQGVNVSSIFNVARFPVFITMNFEFYDNSYSINVAHQYIQISKNLHDMYLDNAQEQKEC